MFRFIPEERMRRMRLQRADVPLEELVVTGRRTGQHRIVLVSLLQVDGVWYVGHPNGDSASWVRDLRAAGSAMVRLRDGREVRVVPTELAFGTERDRAVEAATRQPAPAGPLYRRAQRHVREVGCFFRLDPDEPSSGPSGGPARVVPYMA
jgi:deazaflavin-dependent oxidoreductase (nitroreductase family)